jgi:hypothetical protein
MQGEASRTSRTGTLENLGLEKLLYALSTSGTMMLPRERACIGRVEPGALGMTWQTVLSASSIGKRVPGSAFRKASKKKKKEKEKKITYEGSARRRRSGRRGRTR